MNNALIYTRNGFAQIDTIVKGVSILTHKNIFKPVEEVFCKEPDEAYEISVAGSIPTCLSADTKILVRTESTREDCFLNPPKWKKVKLLQDEDYVGLHINNESTNPYRFTELEVYRMGMYFSRNGKLVTEREKNICKKYKPGEVPIFIVDLPKTLLKYFVLGFVQNKKINEFKFKNEKSAFQMAQILMKLYQKAYTIKNLHINSTDGYYEDGIIWQKSKEIKPVTVGKKKVYDFKTGLFSSFIVNGFFVAWERSNDDN